MPGSLLIDEGAPAVGGSVEDLQSGIQGPTKSLKICWSFEYWCAELSLTLGNIFASSKFIGRSAEILEKSW